MSRRCVKKPLLSQKNIKDRMKFLVEYGKFDSEWFSTVVWSAESRFQLHADVFEDLVRKILNKHFSATHQLFEANIEWNNIDSSFCKNPRLK